MKREILVATYGAIVLAICMVAKAETTESVAAGASLTSAAIAYRAERIRSFEAENTSASTGGVVFIGDANMERFPLALLDTTFTVINRAIAGETIGGAGAAGLVERIASTVAPLKPAKIFVLTGGTDLTELQTLPDVFLAGYSELLQELKTAAPSAQIYVQGILPFRNALVRHNDTVRILNTRLESLARTEQVGFVPLHNHLADPKGNLAVELTSDGAQLNELGYRKWAAILKRYLK
jgi:lysophospholipase L1-like esterase